MDPALASLFVLAWIWPVPLGLSLLSFVAKLVQLRLIAFWCAVSSIVAALALLTALLIVSFSSRAASDAANVPLWLASFVLVPLVGSLLILVQSRRKTRHGISSRD